MRDDRERFPATLVICGLWVLVYLAMAWHQGALQMGNDLLAGGINLITSHAFGDMTPQDIRNGQVWRALTATFIHYSLLHLGFNTIMMYQLGRLVEPWYGPWQFLSIYVVIGFFGNLLAALIKPFFHHSMNEHSAGGSGVLCGLIALIAVVGWRSRTRFGDFMRAQMVGQLIFIGIMGMVLPQIGNFEHGGGALAGALVGFAHRRMVRWADRKLAWLAGVFSALVLAACVLAQARTDHRLEVMAPSKTSPLETVKRRVAELEQLSRKRAQVLQHLAALELLYRELTRISSNDRVFLRPSRPAILLGVEPIVLPEPPSAEAIARIKLREILQNLDRLEPELATGPTATTYRAWHLMVERATSRRPLPGELGVFLDRQKTLAERLRRIQSDDEKEFLELARSLGFQPVEREAKKSTR